MYERLTRIDALRGLAILGVISVHATQIGTHAPKAAGFGQYGVQLFFLVSGYIMCYVASKGKFEPVRFFIRRFFRLAPLYYLVLIICFLIGFNEQLEPDVNFRPLDFVNLTWHLFFLHGIHPDYLRSIFSVMWSLTPEVVFYLLFPVLVNRSNRTLWVLLGLFLVLANLTFDAQRMIGGISPTLKIWLDHSPLNNMFCFLFGMLVFRMPGFFQHKAWMVVGVISIAAFIVNGFSGLGKPVLNSIGIISRYRYHGLITLCFPFLVYARHAWLGRILDNRLLASMGRVSFSAFFLHYAVIRSCAYLNVSSHYAIMLPAVVGFTYLLSSLSYKYIEQPGIRLGRRFENRTPLGLVSAATIK